MTATAGEARSASSADLEPSTAQLLRIVDVYGFVLATVLLRRVRPGGEPVAKEAAAS